MIHDGKYKLQIWLFIIVEYIYLAYCLFLWTLKIFAMVRYRKKNALIPQPIKL